MAYSISCWNAFALAEQNGGLHGLKFEKHRCLTINIPGQEWRHFAWD